jgi:hypothetical protein
MYYRGNKISQGDMRNLSALTASLSITAEEEELSTAVGR